MLDHQAEQEVRAAAVAYCEGLHHSDASIFETLCHERYFMVGAQGAGETLFFDKTRFIDRIRARDPFPGAPSYQIVSVDVEENTASVKLWVDMPPRRFVDYLGFARLDGDWRLMTKLFRVGQGPAL
ncbi:MAG: nuclear transport factor 2 family protein [Pseudomonadota bacterium]